MTTLHTQDGPAPYVVKPRLKLVNGWWECGTAPINLYLARTPYQAWSEWTALTTQGTAHRRANLDSST